MRRVATVAVMCFAVLGAGCGGADDGTSADVPAPSTPAEPLETSASPSGSTSSEGGVDWQNYAPTVRTRIDGLAAAKNCDGLQAQLDMARANDTAQRNRTGDGNADLMAYIDRLLRDAGCY